MWEGTRTPRRTRISAPRAYSVGIRSARVSRAITSAILHCFDSRRGLQGATCPKAYIYNGILPQAPKKVKTFRRRPPLPFALIKWAFFRDVLSRFSSIRHFFASLILTSFFSKLNLPYFRHIEKIIPLFCALCQVDNCQLSLCVSKVKENYHSKKFQKSKRVNFSQTFVQLPQIVNAFFYIFKINFFAHFISKFKNCVDFFSHHPFNYFFTLFSHMFFQAHPSSAPKPPKVQKSDPNFRSL